MSDPSGVQGNATPYEKVLAALGPQDTAFAPGDPGYRTRGTNYLCPAHPDKNPSLSVMEADDGKVLLHCFAGCATPDVVAAMGLDMADLRAGSAPAPEKSKGKSTPSFGKPEAVYHYTDELGDPLFEVHRFAGKRFGQRNAKTGEWNLDGVRRVLYRLPRMNDKEIGGTIYVVEGERDVHSIEDAGGVATCSPGGAGKWRADYSAYLMAANVVVVADKDAPGRKHAAEVAESVRPYAASVSVVEAVEGKDATDHLNAGHGLDEFVEAKQKTPLDKAWDDAAPAAKLTDWAVRYYGNDLETARRFIDRHGEELLALGRDWYVWDGTRYARDVTGRVVELMKETARTWLGAVMYGHLDDDERKQWLKAAIKYHGAPAIRNVLELARTDGKVSVRSEDLNADGNLLNVLNGTIDLRRLHPTPADPHPNLHRTFELCPHNRADRITMLAPVTYQQGANWTSDLDGGFFREFLETTLPDPAVRRFVQTAMGYSLIGGNPEERLFYVLGPGRSGKSTLITANERTLGDYARTADFGMFTKSRFKPDASGARPELMALRGSRFISAVETESDRELALGILKLVTGGERLTGRSLYKDQEEFVNTWTPWLVSNDAPRIDDDDDAFWNRIIRIPFEHVVEEHDRDPAVKAQLSDPANSGDVILAWLLEGLARYYDEGLVIPDTIKTTTRTLRTEMNPLIDFFEGRCVFGPDLFTSTESLFFAYGEWCRLMKVPQVLTAPRAFGKRLSGAGKELKPAKGPKGQRGWQGIGLMIRA